jgi:hypothetical protein
LASFGRFCEWTPTQAGNKNRQGAKNAKLEGFSERRGFVFRRCAMSTRLPNYDFIDRLAFLGPWRFKYRSDSFLICSGIFA